MIRVHFADRPPQTLDVVTFLPAAAIACRVPAASATAEVQTYAATRYGDQVTCGSCQRMLKRRARGLRSIRRQP